jgi:hypothetical protein
MADTTMNVKLSADIGELTAGLAQAQAGLKAFSDDVAKMASQAKAAGTATSANLTAGLKNASAQAGGAASSGEGKSEKKDPAQAETDEINKTLAGIKKPKAAPKSSDGGGLLTILGLDDAAANIKKAGDDAQAAYDESMARLQADFASQGGKQNLKDFAGDAMTKKKSGADVQKDLAANGGNTAGQAKTFDEAIKLQASYNAKSQQLVDQNQAAWNKDWQGVVKPIGTAFSGALNGMITGTESAGQAMKKAAQSIAMSFINASEQMVIKWATDRLAELTSTTTAEAGKTASVGAGATARTGIQAAASATSKAAQASADSASILSSANTAAAGAFSAVALIPLVGPFLAPVAAAAAFTAVMAYDVISAEGGLERVPFDGMPAILHENETVMPAHVANPMRDFFSNYAGPTAATANGNGGDTHVHVNYAPSVGGKLSRSEFEGTLRDHSSVLARHVGNAARNRA